MVYECCYVSTVAIQTEGSVFCSVQRTKMLEKWYDVLFLGSSLDLLQFAVLVSKINIMTKMLAIMFHSLMSFVRMEVGYLWLLAENSSHIFILY